MIDENMTAFGPRVEDGAIKVYDNNATEDFPVLKAFQQYIDAEQAKSRKRMMLLCLFFSFLMMVVVAVFVTLLFYASSRNQSLNDRLVEYAMKERERVPAAEPSQNASALMMLTSKMEDLKAALAEDRKRSSNPDEENGASKKVEKVRTTAEIEVERLKALLAVEREKAAAEREKLRQAELDAYRRKHYPELYEPKPKTVSENKVTTRSRQREEEEADREIEKILQDIDDVTPIDYFDEEEDEKKTDKPRSKVTREVKSQTIVQRKSKNEDTTPSMSDVPKTVVGIKDANGKTWNIPLE